MDASPAATLFCALVFLALAIKFVSQSRKAKSNLPPSPSKLPIIGHLHLVGKMPHISFKYLADKLGPIIYLKVGEIPTVVVSSSDMAKEVMKTHDRATASRPELYAGKYLSPHCYDIALGKYNAYWKFRRRICVAELLSIKRVQSYDVARKEVVFHLVQRIEASCGSTVNLLYVYDVVYRMVIGRNFLEEGFDEFKGLLNEFTKGVEAFSFREFFPWLEFLDVLAGLKSKLEKTSQRFTNFLNDIIKECQNSNKEKSEEKNFVQVLLNINKDGSGGMPLTMNHVKTLPTDMLVAGTHETVSVVDWAMTEILLNPSLIKWAQVEVRSNTGEKKIVSENDLPQMQYIKAIVKETLRLHPPSPSILPTESIEDITISGHDIPFQTRIFVNVWAIMRDPKLWKDPKTFNPDRFMDNNDIDFRGQNFELLPFGAGRRICPGLASSVVCIEFALAQLLHSFDWELPLGVQAKDLDVSEIRNIFTARKMDLVVVAKPRCV